MKRVMDSSDGESHKQSRFKQQSKEVEGGVVRISSSNSNQNVSVPPQQQPVSAFRRQNGGTYSKYTSYAFVKCKRNVHIESMIPCSRKLTCRLPLIVIASHAYVMLGHPDVAPSFQNELLHLLRRQRFATTTPSELQETEDPYISETVVAAAADILNLQSRSTDNIVADSERRSRMYDHSFSLVQPYIQLDPAWQQQQQHHHGSDLLDAGHIRNHAQIVAQAQQQHQLQVHINRLRHEIQVMQFQQEGESAYPTIMADEVLGNVTTRLLPYIDELRHLRHLQIQRQMIRNQYCTNPRIRVMNYSMDLSIQHHRYLSMMHSNEQQQLLMQTSDPQRRSLVSNALAQIRFNGLREEHRNLPASALPLSSVPIALPVLLVHPNTNESRLSHHQRLLRQQVQVFEANHEDVATHTRGRNKPISYGQVGIRCKHCSHVAVSNRQKGSTYYPSTKLGLYQAAQNMSTTHIQSGVCQYIPESVKLEFNSNAEDRQQKQQDDVTKNSNHGAGRPYWAECASRLGLVDTEHHGIRFIRNLTSNVTLATAAEV